ncbi:MAG: hypothetical protein J5785_06140 [Spirochaetales bacterium]|nr:hypothetical protein [Spirochaetales bacterium]
MAFRILRLTGRIFWLGVFGFCALFMALHCLELRLCGPVVSRVISLMVSAVGLSAAISAGRNSHAKPRKNCIGFALDTMHRTIIRLANLFAGIGEMRAASCGA